METAPYDVARFVEDLRNIVASRSDFSDIVAGVDGFETTNAFWDRLDDGSRPGHARLAKREDKAFGPGDVLTMLPGQIHSVTNDGERTTLSLHVYGTHINHTRRSQFDPQRGLELPFRVKVD